MRISGGRARGIVLQSPKKSDTRPAMDKLRQGVFSSLGARVEGAGVLDLYAGTGSYGLEALSRGAARGRFVERDRECIACVRANIIAVARSAGFNPGVASVAAGDVMLWTPPVEERYDLVFVDPPFDSVEEVAESVFRRVAGFMDPEKPGLLIFEMPGNQELKSDGWELLRRIGHGRDQPTCCFYARV